MTFLPTLRYADVFYGLRTEHLERIEAICVEVAVDQGKMVFHENTSGSEMYIVSRGVVEIQVDPGTLGLETDAVPTTIATLRRGQGFGEVVLVDQGLRSAGARVAAADTRLLVIKRVDLVALCEQDYELGYLLMRNIAADMAFKMRSADLAVREQLLWVSGGSGSRDR